MLSETPSPKFVVRGSLWPCLALIASAAIPIARADQTTPSPPSSSSKDGVSPYSGDLGYPFHNGTGGPAAAFLQRLTGPLVDVSESRISAHETIAAAFAATSVDETTNTSNATVAFLVGPLRLGMSYSQSENKVVDTFATDGLNLVTRYGRSEKDSSLIAALPLSPRVPLTLSLRYGYAAITDTIDNTAASEFGRKTTGRMGYDIIEPGLTFEGKAFEITLVHQPQVNLYSGVVIVQSPSTGTLLTSFKTADGGSADVGVTYRWFGGLAPSEKNSPSLLVGERKPVGNGELGFYLRRDWPHNQNQVDANPDNITMTSYTLVGAYSLKRFGRIDGLFAFTSGSLSYTDPSEGSVQINNLTYSVQLAYSLVL